MLFLPIVKHCQIPKTHEWLYLVSLCPVCPFNKPTSFHLNKIRTSMVIEVYSFYLWTINKTLIDFSWNVNTSMKVSLRQVWDKEGESWHKLLAISYLCIFNRPPVILRLGLIFLIFIASNIWLLHNFQNFMSLQSKRQGRLLYPQT